MVIATDSWPLKMLDQQVNYELNTLTILEFLLVESDELTSASDNFKSFKGFQTIHTS